MVNANNNRGGFVGLIVLVSVAIVLILYMTTMKSIFPGVGSGGGVQEDRPWLLDELILPADEIIDMPEEPKLVINEDFTVDAEVSRNDSDRGIAQLLFSYTGNVSGKWFCEYTHEDRTYNYAALYSGNIVTDKTFSDKNGKDKSLLFFIVKGNYTQRVYHPEMGDKITKGVVYLSGWVGPDKGLVGKLTVTTDNIEDKDKWSASYDIVVPAE